MPARKGSKRRYGAAAKKTVSSAMRRAKHGTLKSGKETSPAREEPQAGHRDRAFGGSKEGREGSAAQEFELSRRSGRACLDSRYE